MEDQKRIMTLKTGIHLKQLSLDGYVKLGVMLAESSLSTVDFKKIEQVLKQTHEVVVKEYSLLKTGMYETWEVLYYEEA